MYHTFIIVLFVQYLSRNALAYPTKAGSCSSEGGVGGSHEGDQTGPVAEGGYQVHIDGVSLNSGIAETIEPGIAHEVIVNGTAMFKGFLIKLSGPNGEDASTSLMMNGGDNSTQVLDGCEDTAAALCHTNNTEKMSVSSKIMHMNDGDNLTLEVTLVSQNSDSDEDAWYYTPYMLKVESTTTQPPTISTSPTPIPVETTSMAPTPVPVETTSMAPTPAETTQPTVTSETTPSPTPAATTSLAPSASLAPTPATIPTPENGGNEPGSSANFLATNLISVSVIAVAVLLFNI